MGLSSWREDFKFKKKRGEKSEEGVEPEELEDLLMTGEEVLARASDSKVSTGVLAWDYITGGGWGCGGINEVAGLEACGKTTLALQTIAHVQKKLGKAAVLVDAEQSTTRKENIQYAIDLGVDMDPDKFVIITSPKASRVRQIVMNLLEKAEEINLGIIVIDSVTAIDDDSNFDQIAGNVTIGHHARFWSDFGKVLSYAAAKAKIPVLLINQTRKKIESGGSYGYGKAVEDVDQVTGGNALRYAKLLSIYLQPSSKEKDKSVTEDELTGQQVSTYVGNKIFGKVIKNKLAKPFMQGYGSIRYGKGFDNLVDAIDIFEHNKIVKQGGKFYTFTDESGNEVKVVGKSKLYDELAKRPDLCNTWIKGLGLPGEYF